MNFIKITLWLAIISLTVLCTGLGTWYLAERTWNRCMDSDGRNTSRRGTVQIGKQQFTDICLPEDKKIMEFRCRNAHLVGYDVEECKTGCKDGACLPCGNGKIEGKEECDDGNIAENDGCSIQCKREFCGDGILQGTLEEECDDGNTTPLDGCSEHCRQERCGDGIVQEQRGELCDDGNTDDTDACLSTCLPPIKGSEHASIPVEEKDASSPSREGVGSITLETVSPGQPGGSITVTIILKTPLPPTPFSIKHTIDESGFIWKNFSFTPSDTQGSCNYDALHRDIICSVDTADPVRGMNIILTYDVLPSTLCPATNHHHITLSSPHETHNTPITAMGLLPLECLGGLRPRETRYCCSAGAICQKTVEPYCTDGAPSMEQLSVCNALCTSKGIQFQGREVLLGTWSPLLQWMNLQVADMNGDGQDDILGRTLEENDVFGKTMKGNELWVGLIQNERMSSSNFGKLNSTPATVQTGDFNGDRKDDIVGMNILENGSERSYVVALSTGEAFTNPKDPRWEINNTVDIYVGNFSGRGEDDVLLRTRNNDLWIARSNEKDTSFKKMGALFPLSWDYTFLGDVDGNGTEDLIARTKEGEWYVAMLKERQFQFSRFLQWPEGITWKDVRVGDFNGDRKTDIAGRVGKTREWWVGISDGSTFHKERWGIWPIEGVDTDDVRVGDFNGDGRDDVIGRRKGSNEWVAGISQGSAFLDQTWGTWSEKEPWLSILVGDFNGDEIDDIVGRTQDTGEWHALITQATTQLE